MHAEITEGNGVTTHSEFPELGQGVLLDRQKSPATWPHATTLVYWAPCGRLQLTVYHCY